MKNKNNFRSMKTNPAIERGTGEKMKNSASLRMIAGATLFALMLSLAMPLVARAQDETATPTPTLESSATPTDVAPTATAEPPTATSAASTDTATSTQLPSETETASETPTVDLSATATATLTETPTETATFSETPTPTITPTHGVPLGSSVFPDNTVLWCPATVAVPTVGLPCSPAETQLVDVMADLIGLDPVVDGTIWIGKNYSDGNDTIFDGTLFVNMDTHKITVKGGWTGMSNTIQTAFPSQIAHRLAFQNWQNDVTLNDFDVNGVTAGTGLTVITNGNIVANRISSNDAFGLDGADFINSSGVAKNITISASDFNLNPNGYGVLVQSNGNISLSSVNASDNSGIGASLLTIGSDGKTITVANSTFSTNSSSFGVRALTRGAITFTNVTAIANTGTGVILDNYQAGAGTGNVIVNGGTFSSNTTGLEVDSMGTLTLTNIIADSNNGTGVDLNNSLATTPKTVTFLGASEISDNDGTGLGVLSDGLVSLKDVTASENGIVNTSGSGLDLDNSTGTAGVTLSGTSIFTGNYNHGALIRSKGPVLANNVIANSNIFGSGADIGNDTSTSAQPVTLAGSSILNYNGAGLSIDSNGTVTLSNITANGNTAYGVQVLSVAGGFTSPVKLTGTSSLLENGTHGLYIETLGAVSLSNMTTNDNGQGGLTGSGIFIANDGTSDIQNITLTGVNSINNNYSTNLEIQSNGTVLLNSVNAGNSQTGFGLYIQNTLDGLTNSKKGITLTGTNVMNDNELSGISAQSYGPIILTNVNANSNGDGLSIVDGRGAVLSNDSAFTPQTVTISGINSFSQNYSDGLVISTDGLTSANSVTASSNGLVSSFGTGVSVSSFGGGATGGATFTGANTFSGNYNDGLYIGTLGTVSLANVTANSSLANNGAYIDNNDLGETMAKNVTLSGINNFSSNFQDGLYVRTYGDILVNSVTASGNGTGMGLEGDGLDFNNANVSTTIFKKITLTGTNAASDNYHYGAWLRTDGLISVNSLTASGNGENGGALLDNDDQLENTAGITLTGTSKFIGNDGTGLVVTTNGPITASNLTATGNLTFPGHGVSLDNDTAATPQKVTLTGTNVFSDNNNTGLYVESKGAVALNSVTAIGNDDGGAIVYNNTSSGFQPFTLTGTNAINLNNDDGLTVTTKGVISIANLTANENGMAGAGSGAYLSNFVGVTTAQKVAFTGVNTFNGNNDHGLLVQTIGAITSATKLTANENGDRGLFLSNTLDDALPATAITLSGTNIANLNGGYGMQLTSFGMVTVNNATAGENGQAMGAQGSGLIIVNNGDPSSPVPMDVKLTGTNSFLANQKTGLDISTYGNISLSSINSSDSVGGYGAELESTTEAKTLTMTGNNYFNNNYGHGIDVSMKGNITINNLNASLNGTAAGIKGASIQNYTAGSARTVVLTGTNVFIDNYENGLEIISKGAITLNNVRAHNNGTLASGTGAYIDNAIVGTPGVTLNGINSFRNNRTTGLQIDSDGAVVVNKVTIENTTDGDGLWIEPSASTITLMCGIFTSNGENGYDVTTSGLLKLVGVLSTGNTSANVNEAFATKIVVRNCP